MIKLKKELKALKQLVSLEKPRRVVKKRGRRPRRFRPREIGKYDTVEDRLINELVRVTILEEKIERTFSETFLILLDESPKQKMYKLAMESAEHYHMLVNTVYGLEKFKMKYKERFIGAPPFKFQKKNVGQILEDQLTLVRSAAIVYEIILKFLGELSGKAEIKRGGLRINLDELKLCCKKISAIKKHHISIIEGIFEIYRETHTIPRF